MSAKLDNFESAFRSGTGGSVRTCNCGRTYFNPEYLEEQELTKLKALQKEGKATEVDYTISDMDFEGKEFATNCGCWHERALKIMGFIDGHGHKIAEYLKLEKARKLRIANNSPVVEP